jgi:hypothetical protein
MVQNGFGDITLALKGADRIGWVHLWPSVRPWRIAKPEPTLRSVADVQMVAEKLRDAWVKSTGLAANVVTVESAVQNDRRDGALMQVSVT